MTQIRPNLWLGGDYATTNPLGHAELEAHGITAVLNVAPEVNDTCYRHPESRRPLTLCKVGLHENSADTRLADIYAAVQLLNTLLDAGHSVYVHCHAGADRAPYVTALCIMQREGKAFYDTLEDIRKVRDIVLIPNPMQEWYGTDLDAMRKDAKNGRKEAA